MTARSRQPMSPLTLDAFTDEQLQAELDNRKARSQVRAPLDTPDFGNLVAAVVAHTEECATGDGEDGKQWIFEAALEAVYGPDVWDWYNNLPGNR